MIVLNGRISGIGKQGPIVMSEGLAFFRKALRIGRGIPSPLVRKKFAYNMREIVEFYQGYGDEERMSVMFGKAARMLDSLSALLNGPKEDVATIFKPFAG